jgi:hypothetical protein
MKPANSSTSETIRQMVSIVSMSAQGANAVLQLIPRIQPLLARLEQELSISGSPSKNLWWTSHMDSLAKQFFNSPWLPKQDHNLDGVNLTGIWSWTPAVTGQEVYIRQFFTWVDLMFLQNRTPTVYCQGFLNTTPMPHIISVSGYQMNRVPFSMWARLYTRGHLFLEGETLRVGQTGYHERVPFMLTKVQ